MGAQLATAHALAGINGEGMTIEIHVAAPVEIPPELQELGVRWERAGQHPALLLPFRLVPATAVPRASSDAPPVRAK